MFYVLLTLLIAMIVYMIVRYMKQRKFLHVLTEDEFKKGYRKAQLIDVREPQEFDKGHILGARNIPLTQMKHRLVEIRQDKPVYLYCQNNGRSTRAAHMLHKKGYRHIYQLKGGFKKWTGRIKKKN